MRSERVAAAFAFGQVWVASILVPRAERRDWAAEWIAELHHLIYSSGGRLDEPCCASPVQFSRGAFTDAWCLRREHLHTHGVAGLQRGTAGRCTLILASLAATAMFICLVLPGARRAMCPVHPSRTADLVTISPAGYAGAESPAIPLQEYREWQTNTGKLFSELAWYHPSAKNVTLGHGPAVRLSIGVASANFFQVLRIPVSGASKRDATPMLVLTRSAGRALHQESGRPLGGEAIIDGSPVRTAVLRDDDDRLPDTVQAWLLESTDSLQQLSPHAEGFAFARIRCGAFPSPRGGVRTMLETRFGVTHVFDCVSLSWLAWQPTSNFLFALLLACLALPATTALPLGDYPRYRGRMVFRVSARRWSFLCLKLVLLLALVYFATIAIAWGPAWAGSTCVFLQVITAFPALLFGFRWCLQDQRRRCPECLRRLSSPARVGQASCNFLSWNGTELFCVRGHGLLHIPELPTSWFGTQRWLCLDSSWRCLFPESCAPSAEWV
jgi:hypothetical protein